MAAAAPATASLAASAEAAFDGFLAGRRGEPSSLVVLRRRALDRFLATGLPSRRDEAWRFTSVASLDRWSLAPPTAAGEPEATLDRWLAATADRLVFVDGVFAPALSSRPGGLPRGVTVEPLAEALARRPARVEAHLARHARPDRAPFVALNTAFQRDGALVEVATGATLAEPLHLVHVVTRAAAGRAVFPRALVVLGEGARATVVESYLGDPGPALVCPVTELVVGPGAACDHCLLAAEGLDVTRLARLEAVLDRDASLAAHAFSLGGGLTRTELRVALDGEGASADLAGLSLTAGRQHCDTALTVRHARPGCTSRELFKGVLDGASRTVFTGRIVVDPGAVRTDALLSNRNLLLSDAATAHSNPQLEISADDVRCTHGSAVGQLEEDALFYLRARGLGREVAASLLTWAFAAEVVARVGHEPLRRALTDAVLARLPHGELAREAT